VDQTTGEIREDPTEGMIVKKPVANVESSKLRQLLNNMTTE
jgi:hypothetical protein